MDSCQFSSVSDAVMNGPSTQCGNPLHCAHRAALRKFKQYTHRRGSACPGMVTTLRTWSPRLTTTGIQSSPVSDVVGIMIASDQTT